MMFNSVILAVALLGQCSGGSCGGGGSYFGGGCSSGSCGGGGYYSGSCGQSYSGGCVSGSCGQSYGSYYGGVVRTTSQTTFQIVNTGHELTRSYAKASIDGKNYNIPVINGKLPIITCYGSRFVLDYSNENYVYTSAYSSGVNYCTTTAHAHKTKNGPAALKNYDTVKPANKVKKGPSGLKTPDALEQKKAVSEELPSSVLGPSRPSDAEIDYLLK